MKVERLQARASPWYWALGECSRNVPPLSQTLSRTLSKPCPEPEELYDLLNDPHECHNLVADVDQKQIVDALSRRVQEREIANAAPNLAKACT